MHLMKKKIIIVCGPTGVGKTDLSIKLALHFQAEIISFDSRQFFIETTIGTAKPDAEQLATVPHHFINSHHVWEYFSAGEFAAACNELMSKERDKNFVLVGGSGMYIDALVNGLDDLPAKDFAIRKELDLIFETGGIEALQQKLKLLDEVFFSEVDIFNKQRLMRAIEVCLVSGKTYSSFLNQKKHEFNFQPIFIGLNLDREVLYNRINLRVDQMLADGLQKECEQLMEYKDCNALKTVGYKELFAYLNGQITCIEAVNLIKQHTRNYAKRQLTWFRRNKQIKWFEPSDFSAIVQYIDEQKQG
jgi:tRNA dimethylallyltransferase